MISLNISSGLSNLGNTCFFNSVLQLLYQCSVLNKILLSNHEMLNSISSDIIKEYLKFLLSYQSANGSFAPIEITNFVSRKLNRLGYSQEDVNQYLLYIIDTLIDDLTKWMYENSYDDTSISDNNLTLKTVLNNLFTMKIEKTISCPECSHKSKSNETNSMMYLSINENDNNNFATLIDQYLFSILDEENKYKCEKCNKYVQAFISNTVIYPKYLIICIKRYDNRNQKLNNKIDIPLTFINRCGTYKLRGFIYHSGNTGGGHYMYIGKKDDKWYLYNDSSVSQLDDISNYSSYGYIYLYTKHNN
jgi:ubiquitin carboxyl-terminal hydrolase 36/42